jgi:hypothetical protein
MPRSSRGGGFAFPRQALGELAAELKRRRGLERSVIYPERGGAQVPTVPADSHGAVARAILSPQRPVGEEDGSAKRARLDSDRDASRL